ncbi:hypothetical protein B0A52_08534 [Exophiala mesophila]|uniref:Uncharacterized protein n=1 Tax=Exophiala mesophila TaxID=212818 RepID=A0A438MXT3_EXOME|nr:hypothetical protein B0A52_08534 [Exophiala mesophila]
MAGSVEDNRSATVASGVSIAPDESVAEEVARAPGHGSGRPELLEYGTTFHHEYSPNGGVGYAYHYGHRNGQPLEFPDYGNTMTTYHSNWNPPDEYVRSFANEVVSNTRGVEVVMKPETFFKLSAEQQNMLINVGNGRNYDTRVPQVTAASNSSPAPKTKTPEKSKAIELKKKHTCCMACNSSRIVVIVGGSIPLCSECMKSQENIQCRYFH